MNGINLAILARETTPVFSVTAMHYNHQQHGKTTPLILIIAVIALLFGLLLQPHHKNNIQAPTFEKITLLPKPKPLLNVEFTDHNGQLFTKERLQGKWSILFFAFTNCPDVCPSTLHTLKQVKGKLGQAWSPFQLLMISVDPERDTPERLKQYVPFFDPEFIGLRADLDYTTSFAKNVGVLFFKGKTQKNGGYDVDHSAYMILLNPKGQYAGVISAPHKEATLTSDLTKLSKYAQKTTDQSMVATNTNTKSNARDNDNQGKNHNSDHATSDGNDLVIKNAWIRPAPPNAAGMAAYLEIENRRSGSVNIVGVHSPVFNEATLHQTLIERGAVSMKHVSKLKINAGEVVTLEPMNTHIMLMEPDEIPQRGSKVPLQLTLESGETLNINIEVRNNPNAE